MISDDEELIARACKAFMRLNPDAPFPSRVDSEVEDYTEYELLISLRNVNGVLAEYVFNLHHDTLRRIR